MRLINSERLEYARQPHILAMVVIAVLLITTATYTGWRRVAELRRLSSASTESACMELVGDDKLCKFAATSEQTIDDSFKSVAIEEDETGKTTITTYYENEDRRSWYEETEEDKIGAFVLLDADNYAMDYSDGVWAHYRDESFVPTAGSQSTKLYDFSSPGTVDASTFRKNYKRLGEEACGDLTCLKYEIAPGEGETATTYIWFDTTNYLLRRHLVEDGTAYSDASYSYEPITVDTPSPTKEVSEAEFDALLGLTEE